MVKSMTGYGSGSLENEDYKVTIEIKTLNSKFLDINFRPPRILNEKEPLIRNIINEKLRRGKVSLTIEIESKSEEVVGQLFNDILFRKYYQEIEGLAKSVEAPRDDILSIVLQLPEVHSASTIASTPDELWEMVEKCLQESTDACNAFRENEGLELQTYLEEYCINIAQNREKIIELEKGRSDKIRQRIEQNLNQYLNDQDLIDQNRLEQEIVYYLEKLDIHEELDRLKTHLNHFEKVLNEESENGKKLGFISQEIGREINTIGSKANDADMQKFVVRMKESLEKIKEQVLNIL